MKKHGTRTLALFWAFAAFAALWLASCANTDDGDNDATEPDEAVFCTVTFDAGTGFFPGGTTGGGLSEDNTLLAVTVTRGKTVSKPATVPEMTPDEPVFYHFQYWVVGNSDERYDFSKAVLDDITLTAHYTFTIEGDGEIPLL